VIFLVRSGRSFRAVGPKYKLGLILAHQQTGQLSQDLLREILGNVSTLLTFNVSHADALKLSREYVFNAGGDAEYLPPEEFIRLKTGEAIGKIGKSVFPLHTHLAPQRPDVIRAKDVIERSRKNYGMNKTSGAADKPMIEKTLGVKPEETIDPSQVF
jgi:hypothetical protein